MDTIKTSGFRIKFYGDTSVGIFDAVWEINGDCYFDSPAQLKEFKEKLQDAFEYVSDTPLEIKSYEELRQDADEEEKYFSQF